MRRALFAFITIMVAACAETLEPLPLNVTVVPNKSITTRGDSITFLVTAQGGSLVGVQIDYADATGDQFATSGARTASITFHHAYATAGTYAVTVTVTDGSAGEKKATTEIHVN
jgi:hypothetical protein